MTCLLCFEGDLQLRAGSPTGTFWPNARIKSEQAGTAPARYASVVRALLIALSLCGLFVVPAGLAQDCEPFARLTPLFGPDGTPSLPFSEGLFRRGERVVFRSSELEPWVTWGTPESTLRLAPGPMAHLGPGTTHPWLTVEGNENHAIHFLKWESQPDRRELWISDGTTAGSRRLGTFPPTWNLNLWSPASYLVGTDRFVFHGLDADHGEELWVSDGTEQGTSLLVDLVPGSQGSRPVMMIPFGPLVAFKAASGEDEADEVFLTDGTIVGTKVLYFEAGLEVQRLSMVGDRLLIVTPTRLLASDGTPGEVEVIAPGLMVAAWRFITGEARR
jgi:ELWxxDGT repeat protein